MSDCELLELAAKAAGIVIDKSPFNGGGKDNDGFDLMGNAVLDWHNNKTWNPIIDDGDALRLSVKLCLKIEHHEDSVVVWSDYIGTGFIPYDGNPCAATRRAIVRAAAEIGGDMP
jgi:hypothetical protein